MAARRPELTHRESPLDARARRLEFQHQCSRYIFEQTHKHTHAQANIFPSQHTHTHTHALYTHTHSTHTHTHTHAHAHAHTRTPPEREGGGKGETRHLSNAVKAAFDVFAVCAACEEAEKERVGA